MRKLTLVLALTFITVPLFAESPGRSHSYFTYDDGGTVIKQGEDGREIDARVNLPVFPGDEVTTSRRGRVEIRLADGNVIALDRSTTVRFQSVLDSYDGDSSQTVVELRAGHVAVQRDDDTHQILRLDTQSGSYAATGNATYAVELDSRGGDRVTVFDGSIEVRTPTRTTRVREGEEARVDNQGIYDLASRRGATDDFERWFLGRSERYRTASSRYLDRSLAYYDDELSSHGTWQFVAGYNSWAWRPRVAAGWRPYYYGSWHHGPSGCLVWASYEPWGWVPYHYGRWAYEPSYGWVWLPGAGYAPAWVYWMYGPSYIGWAPMGWYDCYRPYYNWAYRPYSRAGFGFDYGWSGRVNVGNIDLRPWTFVQPSSLIARRVDQAAVSTEIVRGRLLRSGGESPFATVSSVPARFSRNEIKDPTAAVNVIARRGIGSGTGKEGSGVATDMTPYFRRDPELSNNVRERLSRTYRSDQSLAAPVGAPSGVPTPGTAGTLEGRVPTDGGGRVRSETGQGGIVNRGTPAGTIGGTIGSWRGNEPSSPQSQSPADRGTIRRDESSSSAPSTAPSTSGGSQWRERVTRPSTPRTPPADQHVAPTPERTPSQDWRGRTIGRRGGDSSSGSSSGSSSSTSSDRGSEVPRRIIDSIGGGRVSGDRERSSTPRDTSAPRDSSRDSSPRYVPRESTPRESSPPRESAPRDSGRVERSSPPPSHSSAPPPSSSSSSAPRSQDGGGSGRIKRD